ncbi:hypothetical protein M0805_009781 [Coniferiporia weirii]|nr:hypothetical protein M0805_009781 [Coniferiporia weirii]
MYSTRSDAESIASTVRLYVTILDIDIYGQIALATLLAYDILITMDKEVKYFWSSPGKLVSILFFMNRYIGLSSALLEIWGKSPFQF